MQGERVKGSTLRRRTESSSSVRAVELAADLAQRLAHDALDALASRGITAAPLKGVLLLRLWPELRGRRDLSDVDLLVSPGEFTTSVDALCTLGFEVTSQTTRGATLASDKWPLSLDLHHRLFPPFLFRFPTAALLQRAERNELLFDRPILRLDDRDLFAHVLGHAVKSRVPADAEHVVDDVEWLLRALDVEPRRYATHLRRAGMRRAAAYVLGSHACRALPRAAELVEQLHLSAPDRATIRLARAQPMAYFTPHLLNESFVRGAASFAAQVPEALHWRVRRWASR
jgi:hypothetical protein